MRPSCLRYLASRLKPCAVVIPPPRTGPAGSASSVTRGVPMIRARSYGRKLRISARLEPSCVGEQPAPGCARVSLDFHEELPVANVRRHGHDVRVALTNHLLV